MNNLKRKPFFNKKKRMSVAIGLICRNAILFVAETQTTRNQTKKFDGLKVGAIEFANQRKVLIAHAGNEDRAFRILEIMESLAAEEEIKDNSTVSNVVRKAMLQARIEMREQNFNCSAEELQDYIYKHDQDCWIMTGYYFEEEPMIHTAIFSHGVCTRIAPKYYTAIGTGADLADYILKQFTTSDMDLISSFGLLLYAVEEIKGQDTYCGGSTTMAMTYADNETDFVRGEVLDEVIKDMTVAIKPNGQKRLAELKLAFESTLQEWSERLGLGN